MTKEELEKISKKYTIISLNKISKKEYSEQELKYFFQLVKEHFYNDGIINCPYVEDNTIKDSLILISKTSLK